jgi:hypothetical protein
MDFYFMTFFGLGIIIRRHNRVDVREPEVNCYHFGGRRRCPCRKLVAHILVVQPAQDWHGQADGLDGA